MNKGHSTQQSSSCSRTEKALNCWKLYIWGKSYRDVAKELGISKTTVAKYIKETVDELVAERRSLGEDYVQKELDMLDVAIEAITPRVKTGNEDSIATMLKLQVRRAKYLGLDSPEKLDVKGDLGLAAAIREGKQRADKGE